MIRNEAKIGYSLALLDIAREEKKLNQIYEQINTIIFNLDEQPQFIELLDKSYLPKEKKELIIKKTFQGFHWSLINVMQMLAFKNQYRHLKDVLKILNKNLQDLLNIKQGIVYSTNKLKIKEIKQLEKKLSHKYHCQIKLINLIDHELIGGFKIQLDSLIIEDSIKSELNLIKRSLKERGGV